MGGNWKGARVVYKGKHLAKDGSRDSSPGKGKGKSEPISKNKGGKDKSNNKNKSANKGKGKDNKKEGKGNRAKPWSDFRNSNPFTEDEEDDERELLGRGMALMNYHGKDQKHGGASGSSYYHNFEQAKGASKGGRPQLLHG